MVGTKSHRPARIAELLKEEVGQIINYELDDPRIKPTTVTHVKVSSDLRHARVHVSLIGSETEIQETLRHLNRAAGYIRKQLYPRLYLRFIPQFTFAYDDSLETAIRIEQLLEQEAPKPSE